VPQRKPFLWDYSAQPKESVSACNACGGTYWVTLADRDRYGFAVQTHCCYSCGLVFLSPRMTAEAYAEFYVNTYRDLIAWYSDRPHDIVKGQERYAEKLIPILEAFVPEGAETLLDIGGAPGRTAFIIADQFKVIESVVDPAEADAEEHGRIRTSFEDWKPFGKWDLILMCQTVDHLLDLKGGLEKVRGLLTDNGIFWVDAVDWLYRLRQTGSVEGAVKIDHTYNLTEASFERLLWGVGLRKVRKVYQGPHIGYVLKKGDVGKVEPDSPATLRLLGEIRKVQASQKR